jgi:hypothetical protein
MTYGIRAQIQGAQITPIPQFKKGVMTPEGFLAPQNAQLCLKCPKSSPQPSCHFQV